MTTTLFDLTGKLAMVTGAAGGLGQQFARTLHAAGASVVVTGRDINDPRLLLLQQELTSRCTVLELDVCDAESVLSAFDTLAKSNRLANVLINNAGVARGTLSLETAITDYDEVMTTNLRGPWLVAQQFAKPLLAAGAPGSLINICSILGSRVGMATLPYSAAKAGLLHCTRALALEWARYGIRVNSISPGYIETNMTRDCSDTPAGQAAMQRIPQRQIGQPGDLDGVLLLLASDASRYMTGSDLVVDGGHLCSGL